MVANQAWEKIEPVRSESAATSIYRELRRAILEGQVQPGEPLRQDELARLFKTSRIPVREAILKLEEQGLVRTERYKGAFVVGIEADEVREIFDFRALVEARVIELAVPKLSEPEIDAAREANQAFSTAAGPAATIEFNARFHQCLYGASGLAYHLAVVREAMARVGRFVQAHLALTEGLERAVIEHRQILDACARGDASAAASLTRDHILYAKDGLLAQLR